MPAPESVKKLIETFGNNLDFYKSTQYNEAQLRQEFLEPSVPTIPASALLDSIRQIFDSYEIVSDYESIYGDTFKLDTAKQHGETDSVPS